MQSVGLIGLGNAGRPMAERILSKGYALTVFDIDNAKVQTAVERGALAANSAEAAVGEITITLLPSSVEVRQAILGEGGALGNLKAGMTLVDLSGTDPDCARELQERLGERQVTFIGGTIHASGAPAVTVIVSEAAPTAISKLSSTRSCTCSTMLGFTIERKPFFSTSIRYSPGGKPVIT